MIPKDVAGEASQQEQGTAQGKAAFSLPTVMQTGERMLAQIDEVLNDPALGGVTGVEANVPFTVRPGSARVESRLKQIQGNTFLTAFESLKGAGAITQQEGAAATEALNRLNSTNMGDKDYVAALNEFKVEVRKLMEIAQQKAGQQPAQVPAGQADPLGIR